MVGWAAVAAVVLAGTGAQAAKAPCPHPYFPMAEGTVLTYRAGKSEVKVRMTDVRKDGDKLLATLNLQHKGQNGKTNVFCAEDGITTELGGLEAAALRMSGMDVRVLSSEGVAIPPLALLKEGHTWRNEVALELKPPEGSKVPFGAIKSTFRKDALIEGTEEITVAGRTFKALRVKNTVTAMAGTSGERTMVSMMWLAPEVGILRIQTGDNVDFELLDIQQAKDAAPAGAQK